MGRMKKRALCFAVICAAAAAFGTRPFAEPVFHTYEQNTSLLLCSPGSLDTGMSGFLNPAFLAAAPGNEFLFTLANEPERWGTVSEFGLFSAFPAAGLGAIFHMEDDEISQMDMRTSLGLGDRTFSIGLANQSVFEPQSGHNTAFHAFSLGTLFRPMPQVSLGIVGTAAYSTDVMELTADLGIRPLGTPQFTIFGDFSLLSSRDDLDSSWSAGAAFKPADSLLFAGRYTSDQTFTLGLRVELGPGYLGVNTRATTGIALQNNAYSIQTGGTYARPRIPVPAAGGPFYLEINLRGTVADRENPFKSGRSLLGLITRIERAAENPLVSGIIVNTSGLKADRETLWELRQALKRFKETGRRVIVFVDDCGLSLYHFASVADRIVMDPLGHLTLEGFMSGRGYLKGTLEKLGIGFEELRYFQYKTAAETFSRDSLSEADRFQYGAYVTDLYGMVKQDLMAARSLSSETYESLVNDVFLLHAREARGRGLVDALGRWEEIQTVVDGLEGSKKTIIRDEPVHAGTARLLLRAIFPGAGPRETPQDRWGEPPRIAVVYAIGATDLDGGMMARRLASDIEEAARDHSVKAIVLRVDSPGGDGVAADYVAEAVRAAKKRKPVIVSMGAVAGSGGYWVSMYGDSVIASPITLTGSIGVIGAWIYDKGLDDKLGLSLDSVQMGKHADLSLGFLIPHRNLSPEEKERFKTMILDMYSDFVGKAAMGRGKTPEEIEKIAQGRIWSGLGAKEIGLVDSLGGLRDAIELAGRKAGIEPGRETVIVEYPTVDIFASLSSAFFDTQARGLPPFAMGGLSVLGLDNPSSPQGKAVEYLRYRLEHNGEPLPMLPMEIMPDF